MSFPRRLYEILSDDEYNSSSYKILSWKADGKSFLIFDRRKLVVAILPKWFHTTKWASFQRQLNIYGFKYTKEGKTTVCYYHENFVRDDLNAVMSMKRTAIKGTLYQQLKPNNMPSICTNINPKIQKKTRNAQEVSIALNNREQYDSSLAYAMPSTSINDLHNRCGHSCNRVENRTSWKSKYQLGHDHLNYRIIPFPDLLGQSQLQPSFASPRLNSPVMDQTLLEKNHNSVYVTNRLCCNELRMASFDLQESNILQRSVPILPVHPLVSSLIPIRENSYSMPGRLVTINKNVVRDDENSFIAPYHASNVIRLSSKTNLTAATTRETQSTTLYQSSMNELLRKIIVDSHFQQQFQTMPDLQNIGFNLPFSSQNSNKSLLHDDL